MLEGLPDDDELLVCDFGALVSDEIHRSRWLEQLDDSLPVALSHDLAAVTAGFASRFSAGTKAGQFSSQYAGSKLEKRRRSEWKRPSVGK